jgi:hypothetical protein
LVRLFARQVYDGKLTGGVICEFRPRVKLAFENHINDVLNARLQNAMHPSVYPVTAAEEAASESGEEESHDSRIVTTQEEVDGYYIVRAIISNITRPERVVARDTISYCGILFDDNNRKPICRLHFNNPEKLVLETFDAERKISTRHKLDMVTDIYNHADALRATIDYYITAANTGGDKV